MNKKIPATNLVLRYLKCYKFKIPIMLQFKNHHLTHSIKKWEIYATPTSATNLVRRGFP